MSGTPVPGDPMCFSELFSTTHTWYRYSNVGKTIIPIKMFKFCGGKETKKYVPEQERWREMEGSGVKHLLLL